MVLSNFLLDIFSYLNNSLLFYLVLEIKSSLLQTYTSIPEERKISQHITDTLWV